MKPTSQFRLKTLFTYTFVIALGFAYWATCARGEMAAFFAIPLLAWPPLFERAVDSKISMRLNALLVAFQFLAVSVFSSLTFMLSAIAFDPSWKGSKGMNWIFYCNDGWAAVIMFPFYLFGAYAFFYALVHLKTSVRSPLIIGAIACNAALSFFYVAYVVVMNFAGGQNKLLFVMVPGCAAVSYTLMAIALARRFEPAVGEKDWHMAFGFVGGFFAGMLAKIPFAIHYYNQLPDERPEDCFVVTAATRGHRALVGTRFNADLDREVNDQLVRFWAFEECLRCRLPRFHRCLRRVYNRIGPLVARQVRFEWQADLVYLLLKPLEWIAVVAIRLSKR